MNTKLLILGLVVFSVALAGCADEEEPAEEEAVESTYEGNENTVTQAPAPTGASAMPSDSGNPIV